MKRSVSYPVIDTAHTRRAQYNTYGELIHQQTNCITETLFEEALEQARELDLYYKKHGTLIGPLHGIPVSVKDQFNVKGVDTTLGYVGRSFKPALDDAALVQILKRLGAVIITKTTIPQSIWWGETESPLWGLTTHPVNASLTPGGSSGGEAALLAMGGSVCGWGTDIGGSIRGPSHFCGLFGLKPSSSRFPYAGVPVSQEGQAFVPSSIGPMASRLSTLVAITRECIRAQPWSLDPQVTPIPWREDVFAEASTRKLKIGVILDDGIVRAHPEIELAVQVTSSLLQKAGHDIVAWDTTDHRDCVSIMDKFYRSDGGEDIRTDVQAAGEPFLPHVAALLNSAKAMSVFEYWRLSQQKTLAQQAYHNKWEQSSKLHALTQDGSTGQVLDDKCVDVIISAVLPHTAVPHRATGRWAGYTKIWNFLDYTAMSFSLTAFGSRPAFGSSQQFEDLSAEREHYQRPHAPRNEMDEWNHRQYNPELMSGLPIGIHITGRRFDEEKVLGVAVMLEGLINARVQGTRPAEE